MYDLDFTALLEEVMPRIHTSNFPAEIKDAWIDLAVIERVSELHEEVVKG